MDMPHPVKTSIMLNVMTHTVLQHVPIAKVVTLVVVDKSICVMWGHTLMGMLVSIKQISYFTSHLQPNYIQSFYFRRLLHSIWYTSHLLENFDLKILREVY